MKRYAAKTMVNDTPRTFVPVICCRKAGPALAGGEVVGWIIGGNKSFLRRREWGPFRRVVGLAVTNSLTHRITMS
jgi:hypothetical protein